MTGKVRALDEAAIRKILITSWDPLGVAGAEGAYDEYDEIGRQVSRLLASTATVDEVADFLHEAAGQLTGIETERARSRRAAELLVATATKT